jgi:hypothetical protein
VHEVDAGHRLEPLAGEVTDRADAGRRHGDLARTGLGERDQLGDGLCRQRGMREHDLRLPLDAGDRRDVAEEDERQLVVERRVDGARHADHQQRVAVGRRLHDGLGRDVGAGAGPVLDDDRLPQPRRQPLPDDAGRDVGRAARGEPDDEAHRPRRIGLRARRQGAHSRERGAGGEDTSSVHFTILPSGPSHVR